MGRTPCCNKVGLKRGPWTLEEDQKLSAYVQEHGHGSWHSLPPKAGLKRCGKSCRLRWTNYLRPNFERGKFSSQEEQTIIRLHAFLGNRWTTIASHLPKKRTGNQIKNHWNTSIKKRFIKMGIDPMTHKPKTHAASGFTQSTDLANLNHMAQWESARLQAEARLVRKPGFLFQLNKATAPPPPRPPPPPILMPPCLNVLKQWQETWTKPYYKTNISTAPTWNSFFEGYSGSLESQTSTLIPHFAKTPTTIDANNAENSGESKVGNPSNNDHFLDELKAIVGNSMQLQDITNPSETSAFVADSLRFPCLSDEFTDFPIDIYCGINAPNPDDGDGLEGFLEENGANYWLNNLTLPANSHLFY
ncbi:uncharacterized protein [Henckelia pumila]|uniref:uncharacterized protein n=1 Tax=Henckelia pumila TaxID=405737 RepID=UPI003C6E391E